MFWTITSLIFRPLLSKAVEPIEKTIFLTKKGDEIIFILLEIASKAVLVGVLRSEKLDVLVMIKQE